MVDHIIKPLTVEEIAELSASHPELSATSLNAYNELTRTSRMLVAQLDRVAQSRPTGLSVGRNAVLWTIVGYSGEEGITPAEIAESLDITRATVTGLLSALEQEGLVSRTPSLADRRRIHVVPTNKARKLIDKEWPLQSRDITLALEELTEREKEQLLKMLRKIRRGTHKIGRNPQKNS